MNALTSGVYRCWNRPDHAVLCKTRRPGLRKKLGLPAHENTDPGDGDGGVRVSDTPRRGGPDMTVAPARRTTVVLNICGACAWSFRNRRQRRLSHMYIHIRIRIRTDPLLQ